MPINSWFTQLCYLNLINLDEIYNIHLMIHCMNTVFIYYWLIHSVIINFFIHSSTLIHLFIHFLFIYLVQGLMVMTTANIVTLLTAISMSAVATNGQIKEQIKIEIYLWYNYRPKYIYGITIVRKKTLYSDDRASHFFSYLN